MTEGAHTTRDQLAKLVDVVRRSLRHTWLVVLFVIIGAGLSVMLALTRQPSYGSEAVLLYQEKISQSVLQGRNVASGGSRTMTARFREMLLSRDTLSAVVEEFNLYPEIVAEQGTIAAAEKLRLLVEFSDRGAGTFRIAFLGETPEQAQQVTARLAALLQAKDESVRKEQAERTMKFLESEAAAAENTLFDAEIDFAEFVTEHPEFVAESMAAGAGTVGASIRAANEKSEKHSNIGNSRLATLQRAARRLKDRIANPNAPVIAPARNARVESPALQQARSDLAESKRSLEDKGNRFTPKHPDVIAAQNTVAEATRRLRRLEAAEKKQRPVAVPAMSPTTSVAELNKELKRIESEIGRIRADGGTDKDESSDIADELVNLETEHTRLQRRVNVASQRLASLESRVFVAEITASSEFAEAAQLVIIDDAYLPARPSGKGRKIIVMAGTLVFGFLGGVVALGLGLIDDRIYRREDISELGLPPVLVVIPKQKKRWRSRRG